MPRSLTLRPQAQHEALQAARARQQTDDFKARYATRAGIEGTLSQAVRAFDLRRTRYSGHAKTHLQHVLIAVALNLVRLVSWWGGVPRAQTRPSPFAALMQEAASPDQQFATIIHRVVHPTALGAPQKSSQRMQAVPYRGAEMQAHLPRTPIT